MSLDVKALESLIKGSGLTFRENSVSWIFECPRCNKRDKLYLRKRDGRFVCWHCATTISYQGKPEFALRDLLRRPVGEIQDKLYGSMATDTAVYVAMDLHDFFGDEDNIPDDLLPTPPQVMFPEDFFDISHVHAARGRAYLEGRGITLQMAQDFGLRYHPQERRVIFPIDAGGRLVGWQARTILPDVKPKILTGPKSFTTRDRVLMGQDDLAGATAAILTEGPVDRYKCLLCPAATVCAMGKSVSWGQIELIKKSPVKRLYLAIDADAAAEKTRLCREFVDLEVYDMVPPPGLDFGAMSPEDVLAVFRAARRINAGNVFLAPHVDFFTFTTGQRLE